MADRRLPEDSVLRRARRLVAAAAREVGVPLPFRSLSPNVNRSISPLTAQQRSRIIGLIAELKLSIKAMRVRRDELGEKAGFVFRHRSVTSAYHRTSRLLWSDKHRRH